MSSKVIFSVFKVGRGDNKINHVETMRLLEKRGLEPIEVIRQWEGNLELSIMLTAKSAEEQSLNFALARHYMKLYDQEAILSIDSENEASLFDQHGVTTRIGHWVQVPRAKMNFTDNYSFIDGKYFQVQGV